MIHSESEPENLMDTIDPVLLKLIQTQINTFVKWDLVRFFHEHPHAVETVPNIARLTGRDVRVLEPELIDLVHGDILFVHVLAGMRVYSLNDDDEIRDLVARFIQACEDRQFRIKAIYHVIQSMR